MTRGLLMSCLQAALAAAAFLVVSANEARSELAVGVARDVIHSQDTFAATVRYDFSSVRLGAAAWLWDGTNGVGDTGAVSLDYSYPVLDGRLDLNFGGAYLTGLGKTNGTHLNFSAGAGLNLWDHLRVSFTHFSNGRDMFGWEKDKPNSGWNFLGLAFRF